MSPAHPTPALTLAQLNALDADAFVHALHGVYEHSPWVARAVAPLRPLPSPDALVCALARAVREAPAAQQQALLQAHPELAGKAAVAGTLTAESADEQQRAGLGHCTPEEWAQLTQLNAQYRARFGWPFILAVKGPRGEGLGRQHIIATFARRLRNPPEFERAECLRQVHRIAEIRLHERLGHTPHRGLQILDWADQLAAFSEPGWAEQGQLTVTYLSQAHQACARQLRQWMLECGFDSAHLDAVGNVVGRYEGLDPASPALLTGSHYDTVRNGGRHDGRLGIFVPMVCVRELHRSGRRLPFALEVVAFAEEEGQRFPVVFLGSGTLAGHFRPEWLDQTDAHGITLRQAMVQAGLSGQLADIQALERSPHRYRAFVEVHIEQGPVLDALDLPLGVVTAINGSRRFRGTATGLACHAGTTPMPGRQDAAAAVAEFILATEARALADAHLPAGPSVATVGELHVPGGSINVVPGQCHFTLDARAPNDAQRDALVGDLQASAQATAQRRRVDIALRETLHIGAAPSDPAWQARWEAAVAALGLPVFHLPSGAGHDAMTLHAKLPQAMLFVRGGNAGISHNPLETITADDADRAVRAFLHLLEQP